MKYKRVKYIRGEWYAREVYPYVSVMLSGVASVVPFSLCEVTVLGFVLCLIALPFGMRKHQAPWGKVCVREAEVLLWVYVWFYWAWGMNYFRDDFFTRSETKRVAYEEVRFRQFIGQFVDSLNVAYIQDTLLSEKEIQSGIKAIYRQVPERFGLTLPKDFQHPKRSLVNGLYSKVGVLGYMGPFFDESLSRTSITNCFPCSIRLLTLTSYPIC